MRLLIVVLNNIYKLVAVDNIDTGELHLNSLFEMAVVGYQKIGISGYRRIEELVIIRIIGYYVPFIIDVNKNGVDRFVDQ